MVRMIDQTVNSRLLLTNPDGIAEQSQASGGRRRLDVASREKQILRGAVQFFADNGFNGQIRDLAQSIGVTHTLLYHYFPTKQALIDRVYQEVFEGRWKPEWETLLDKRDADVEKKLTDFYSDYLKTVLTSEFVRILVFSGLTDQTITNRFFGLLRERLFPRLVRETRRYRGSPSRSKASAREIELLMGLHGGFFYIGMRRWVYQQGVLSEKAPQDFSKNLIRDRVRGYLMASAELFKEENPSRWPKRDTTGKIR
ncbi:MAG: TetR/AcrR family transcriptional regulator [Burkholderiales bacterium]